MKRKYSAEEILTILHCFESIKIDQDGCLEVEEKDSTHTSYITSFDPDSFTYDLLCLIEQHMKGD